MEFNGTKGKWEVNPRALRNVKCNELTIANCSAGQSGDKEEEEIANAKLIASAPEMFEILKSFIEDFDNGLIEDFQIPRDRFEKLLTKITQ